MTDLLAALAAALPPPRLALIGAVARNAWAPPRATSDLDLAVAATEDALAAADAALAALGFRCVRRQQAQAADALPDLLVYRRDAGEPRQVDLLVAKTAFEEEALRRAVAVDLPGARIPAATPEDLIVYKLLADRPRDRDDVRAILATQERAGRAIDWAHVERWCAYWEIGDRLARLRGGG